MKNYIQIEGGEDFNFSITKGASFTIWWEFTVLTLKISAKVAHFGMSLFRCWFSNSAVCSIAVSWFAAALVSRLSVDSVAAVSFNLLTSPINLEFSASNSAIRSVKFAAGLVKRIFWRRH